MTRGRWLLVGPAAMLAVAYSALPLLTRLDEAAVAKFSPGAAVTVPGFEAAGAHILIYEHGKRLTVTVPVANSGPLPVTIIDVRLSDDARPLVRTEAAERLPVTLWPGRTAEVELTARFGNCRYYHERQLQTYPGVVVSGHVLGRPMRETVGFDRQLLVHSPMIVGCPDRTLVRDDDTLERP